MIRDGSKPRLQAGAIVFCALTVAIFIFLISPAAGFACEWSLKTFDFGAVEQGNSNAESEVYDMPELTVELSNINCSTNTINSISSSDSTDFPLSNSSDYTPGCLPSYTLSAGTSCYFLVTFTPQGLEPHETTLSITDSNSNLDLTDTLAGAEFSVSPLTDGEGNMNNFALMLASPQPTAYPGYAPVTLNSGNAKITWTGTLSYQTSGGIPKPPASIKIKSFDTSDNNSQTVAFGETPVPAGMPTPSSAKMLYEVAGGQLTLNVEYKAGLHNDPVTNALIGTVTGIPGTPSGIPIALLTNELSTVYASLNGGTPPTKNLFEGIAAHETGGDNLSEAKQFTTETTYNVNSFWPYENLSGAPYVGLMQDGFANDFTSPMTTAWDWVANIDTAYSIFTEKVTTVLSIQTAAHKANKYVPVATGTGALSLLQIEEMDLFCYGGYLPTKSPKTLSYQLLTPQCFGGPDDGEECNKTCTCQWQQNLSDSNPEIYAGTTYVCKVYSDINTNVPAFCN
ncbi:MAG: hypothetical protein WCE23_01220 [Candidatus Binatus sp.]|uniref:hypothetical protein n=1 Tax=Candidatus Binatus sp. TaxID=2811406 RepID=UPI003C76309F